jgi:hypothetical protein
MARFECRFDVLNLFSFKRAWALDFHQRLQFGLYELVPVAAVLTFVSAFAQVSVWAPALPSGAGLARQLRDQSLLMSAMLSSSRPLSRRRIRGNGLPRGPHPPLGKRHRTWRVSSASWFPQFPQALLRRFECVLIRLLICFRAWPTDFSRPRALHASIQSKLPSSFCLLALTIVTSFFSVAPKPL